MKETTNQSGGFFQGFFYFDVLKVSKKKYSSSKNNPVYNFLRKYTNFSVQKRNAPVCGFLQSLSKEIQKTILSYPNGFFPQLSTHSVEPLDGMQVLHNQLKVNTWSITRWDLSVAIRYVSESKVISMCYKHFGPCISLNVGSRYLRYYLYLCPFPI